ncbi:hypothetical protein RCL1_005268 [Eukaryota sp. TZLM3-RCL]
MSSSKIAHGFFAENTSDVTSPQKNKTRSSTLNDDLIRNKRELSASLREFQCLDLPANPTAPEDCPFLSTGIFFWSLLNKGPKEFEGWMQVSLGGFPLNVLVPDTICLSPLSDDSFWLASSSKGVLYRKSVFEPSDVMRDLFKDCHKNSLFAVQKRSSSGKANNTETTILDSKELMNVLQRNSEYIVIQKFIKPRGTKATVYRVFVDHNRSSKIIAVTNEIKFDCTSVRDFNVRLLVNSCDVPSTVYSVSSSALPQLVETAHNLKNSVQKLNSDFVITSFIVDFIIDDYDQPWLINCKAIQFLESSNEKLLQNEAQLGETLKSTKKKSFEKTIKCRFCLAGFSTKELTHRLTYHMIIQSIEHMKQRGVILPFFNRTDLSKIDDASKYEHCRVCEPCYSMYVIENELRELERKFALHTGIQLTSDRSGGSVLPQSNVLSPSILTGEKILSKFDSPQEFRGFRFILFVHDLLGLTVSQNFDLNSFILQFNLFSQQLALPVYVSAETSEATLLCTPRSKGGDPLSTVYRGSVSRMLTQYLFCTESQLVKFLEQIESLSFFLFAGQKQLLGSFSIDLFPVSRNLFIKHELSAVLNSATQNPCRIRITVMLQEIFHFNKSILSLNHRHEFDSVYFPFDSEFYTCDPLPDLMLKILPYKTKREREFSHQITLSRRQTASSFVNTIIDDGVDLCSSLGSDVDSKEVEVDDITVENFNFELVFELQNVYSLFSTCIALGLLDDVPADVMVTIKFDGVENSVQISNLRPVMSFECNQQIVLKFLTTSLEKFYSCLVKQSISLSFSVGGAVLGVSTLNFGDFFGRIFPNLPFNTQQAVDINLIKNNGFLPSEDYFGEQVPWLSTQLDCYQVEGFDGDVEFIHCDDFSFIFHVDSIPVL